jgi:hypothetical protein
VARPGRDGERQRQLGGDAGGEVGVGPEGEHGPGDVGGLDLADGAAGVAHLQLDQALGVVLELGGDRLQDGGALLGPQGRPAAVLEGGPGGGDGPLRVGGAGAGHGGVGLPGGGVDGLEGLARGRLLEPPVHKQLVVRWHVRPP